MRFFEKNFAVPAGVKGITRGQRRQRDLLFLASQLHKSSMPRILIVSFPGRPVRIFSQISSPPPGAANPHNSVPAVLSPQPPPSGRRDGEEPKRRNLSPPFHNSGRRTVRPSRLLPRTPGAHRRRMGIQARNPERFIRRGSGILTGLLSPASRPYHAPVSPKHLRKIAARLPPALPPTPLAPPLSFYPTLTSTEITCP